MENTTALSTSVLSQEHETISDKMIQNVLNMLGDKPETRSYSVTTQWRNEEALELYHSQSRATIRIAISRER